MWLSSNIDKLKYGNLLFSEYMFLTFFPAFYNSGFQTSQFWDFTFNSKTRISDLLLHLTLAIYITTETVISMICIPTPREDLPHRIILNHSETVRRHWLRILMYYITMKPPVSRFTSQIWIYWGEGMLTKYCSKLIPRLKLIILKWLKKYLQ